MRAKITPISNKKIKVEAPRLVDQRISDLLVESLQCSKMTYRKDEDEFLLPDSLTFEDVSSFLSEYFGDCSMLADDQIVLAYD
ncbi:hypothetical protein [Aneurinibacillus sp. REN35]|uniref:hypothetical protein n=1 Tax=Aneurinibacillus sp. REN35 TaxID=3237286 RepID=UPI0035273213